MKVYAALFLTWMFSVSAVNLPLDEGMTTFCLRKGVEVWLKQQSSNPSLVACRFVTHNRMQDKPEIFDLDCSADIFEDELPSFLDYCEEEMDRHKGSPIGLVAVGSMDIDGLAQYLTERGLGKEIKEEISEDAVQIFPSNEYTNTDLRLSYPALNLEVQTDQDLKKIWVFYLIQSMAEARFKQVTKEAGGLWMGDGDKKWLLPAESTVAHAAEASDGMPSPRLLTRFLQAMQILKKDGFTSNEFADSKSKLQKHLSRFYHPSPTPIVLADYYASCLADRLFPIDYSELMTRSLSMISEIGLDDISKMLKVSFLDDERAVTIRCPEGVSLVKEAVQETLKRHPSNNLVFDYQENEEKDPFMQLLINEDEEKLLKEMVQTAAEKNIFELGWIRKELEKKRVQLLHLHPLRSIATMVSDSYTKKCVSEIMSSTFKGGNFMDDFAKRMREEAEKNNLLMYIPGFCRAVHGDPIQVRSYIEKKQYENLIKYILKLP